MDRLLGGYSGYVYALFRIVFGFSFLLHGTQKFFAWPPSERAAGELAGLMLVGAVIELVGGTLIMIGFLSSWAAFISSGMMAVAYFMAHQSRGALPIQNDGELAVLYCFAFLFISSKGSGELSVDSLITGGKATSDG